MTKEKNETVKAEGVNKGTKVNVKELEKKDKPVDKVVKKNAADKQMVNDKEKLMNTPAKTLGKEKK